MKTCSRCKYLKGASHYAKCADAADGHQRWCRECKRKYERGSRLPTEVVKSALIKQRRGRATSEEMEDIAEILK